MATKRLRGTLVIVGIILALVIGLLLLGPEVDITGSIDPADSLDVQTLPSGQEVYSEKPGPLDFLSDFGDWFTGRVVEDEQAPIGTVLILNETETEIAPTDSNGDTTEQSSENAVEDGVGDTTDSQIIDYPIEWQENPGAYGLEVDSPPNLEVALDFTDGLEFASSAANDFSVGAYIWGATFNALANDGSVSTLGHGGPGLAYSNWLTLTNFGFNIPSYATITGIQMTFEGERPNLVSIGSSGGLNQSQLIIGGVVGSDSRTAGGLWLPGGATYNVGGSSDLWGASLTPADVNSANFGVALQGFVNNAGGPLTLQLDYAALTVYYSAGGFVGNETAVATSGVSALDLRVNGNTTLPGSLGGVNSVEIYDGSQLLLNFSHNFSLNDVDFNDVTINVTSEGILVDLGSALASGETKTVRLNKTDATGVCVDDTSVSSFSQITPACNQAGETEFSEAECDANTTKGNLTCTSDSTHYIVSGLSNSGLKIQSLPTITDVVLASSNGANLTSENLTVTFNATDGDNDTIYTSISWSINGSAALRHLWPLANYTGNDESIDLVGGKNLTINAVSNAPDYVSGSISGHGFNFTADSPQLDYFDIDDPSPSFTGSGLVNSTSNGTMMFWYHTSETTRDSNPIYGRGVVCTAPPQSRDDLVLYVNTTSARLVYNNGGTTIPSHSTGEIEVNATSNTWNLVAVTSLSNGTHANLSIYLNGVKGQTSNLEELFVVLSGCAPITRTHYLGRGRPLSTDFDGVIAEVSVWDRALTDEQISAIYASGNRNVSTIVSQETRASQNWTSIVYATELGGSQSVQATSNGLVIQSGPNFNLTSCTDLNTTGDYLLLQNVNSNLTCLNINADNVTLDCQGFNIDYSNTGANEHAIVSSGQNVVIQNCNITGPGSLGSPNAIEITGDNTNVTNNTILIPNGGGLFGANAIQVNANNSYIAHNSITSGKPALLGGQIRLTGQDHHVFNNTIHANGNDAIPILITGTDSLFENNTLIQDVFGSTTAGIQLGFAFADRNIVRYNYVETLGGTTIQATGVETQIYGNTLVSTSGNGIQGTGAHNSTIYDNNITSTSGNLISLSSANNVTIGSNILNLGSTQLSVTTSNPLTLNNSVDETNSYSFTNVRPIFITGNQSIRYYSTLNSSSSSLSADVQLAPTWVFVNSSSSNGLNQSAIVVLSSLGYSNTEIEVDFNDDGTFVVCPANICQVISDVNDTITFNVSHFTNFTVANGSGSPAIGSLILNTTGGQNLTSENLTLHILNVTDPSGNGVKNITDWQVSNQSIAVLNMPFEQPSTSGTGVSNGSTLDYSTFANHGEVYNATYNNTGGVDGRGAYEFNATGYIKINASPSLNITEDLTFEAWINPQNNTDSDFFNSQPIIEYNNGNASGLNFWQHTSFDRLWFAVIDDSGAPFSLASPNGLVQEGQWQHIAATLEGNLARIYYNGDKVAETLFQPYFGSINLLTDYDLYIGARVNENPFGPTIFNKTYYNGSIDEVRVWNRALTEDQIREQYLLNANIMTAGNAQNNELWRACVTPHDGDLNGTQVCSNTLLIQSDNVTNCTTIDAPGTYELTGHATSNDTCMIINSSSVTLDCNGFNITYGNDGGNDEYGIVVDDGLNQLGAITINNCLVRKNFSSGSDFNNYAIKLYNVSGVDVRDTTVMPGGSGNNYGVGAEFADTLIFENFTYITGNLPPSSSSNNNVFNWDTVRDSHIYDSFVNSTNYQSSLVVWDNVINSSIRNSEFYHRNFFNQITDGVSLTGGSDYNVFDRLNFTSVNGTLAGRHTFFLDDSDFNNITNVNGIVQDGRWFTSVTINADASDNYIAHNNFTGHDGIIVTSQRNTIYNNTVTAENGGSNTYGIILRTDSSSPGQNAENYVGHNTVLANGTSETVGIFLSITTNGKSVTNNTVEYNTIHATGSGTSASSDFQGQMGIALTEGFFTSGSGLANNEIRHNNISTSGYAQNYGINILKLNGRLIGASNNTLWNNTIVTQSTADDEGRSHGIYIVDIPGPTYIVNNTIDANGNDSVGIFANFAQNMSISGNTVASDGDALFIDGDEISEVTSHEVLGTNTFNGRSVLYYGGDGSSPACPHGTIVANPNVAHLALIRCENITLTGYDGDNLLIVNSSNNIVDGANISQKRRGIRFYFDNDNNTVRNSLIVTNGTQDMYGIHLYNQSHNIRIEDTTVQTDGVVDSGQTDNHGIFVTLVSQNLTVDNVTVRTTGFQRNIGAYLDENTDNALLLDNDIATDGTNQDHGVFATFIDDINLTGNTINGSGIGGRAMFVEDESLRGYYYNNTFDSTAYYGLHFDTQNDEVRNTTILHNTFLVDSGANVYGLRMDEDMDFTTIAYNNFSSSQGLWAIAASGDIPDNITIFNNTFDVTQYPMYFSGATNISVFNNSITLRPSGASRSAVFVTGAATHAEVFDNNVTGNTGINGQAGLIYVQTSATANVNRNTYFGTGSGSHRVLYTQTVASPSNFTNNVVEVQTNNSGQDQGIYVLSSGHVFENNSFEFLGGGSQVSGIEISGVGVNNLLFRNNSFTLNGTTTIYGWELSSGGTNITFENTFMNVTGTSGEAFRFSSSSDNNFTDTYVYTNLDWIQQNAGEINYFNNLTLDAQNGSITYYGSLNSSHTGLYTLDTEDLEIGDLEIRVDSATFNFLDQPAQLAIRNVNLSNPIVRVDENENQFYSDCLSPQCDFVSNIGGEYVFNVSGFTSYLIVQQATPPNITAVVLNSTLGTNTTNENLTANRINVTDAGNSSVLNITQWYVNGSEINVLNLPFEAFDGPESDFTYDYSDAARNGTVLNAQWNATGGVDGFGAYYYDGVNDVINITSDSALNFEENQSITINLWANPDIVSGDRTLLAKGRTNGSDGGNYILRLTGTEIEFYYRDSGNTAYHQYETSTDPIIIDEYQMITIVYTFGNGSSMQVYHNGTLQTGSWVVNDGNAAPLVNNELMLVGGINIGSLSLYEEEFNGRIDRLQIFNRSLSAAQIAQMYVSDDVIVSNETNVGEVWQARVTLNDGEVVGASVLSNNLTILDSVSNSLPTLQQALLNSTTGNAAVNDEATRAENLTVLFVNASDSDLDTIYNITDWRVDGTSIAVVNMPFESEKTAATTGLIRDYSDYQNNGTLGDGVGSQVPSWNQSGQVGAVYTFDGTDDQISLGDITSLDGLESVSFGAWINPTTYAPGTTGFDLRNIITKGALSGDNTNTIWSMFQGNDAGGHHFQCGVDTTTGFTSATIGAGNFTLGQWTHFLCTWSSGGPVRVYVDGTLVSSSGNLDGTLFNSANELRIGGSDEASEDYFDGSIDEVQIYRAGGAGSEAQQIANWYAEGTQGRHISNYVMLGANVGEVWSVQVTPNDGSIQGDGVSVFTNNVTIVNSLPSYGQIVLNSTTGRNLTTDNLTATILNLTDIDDESIKNITDWKVGGSSIAILNMPFEGHSGDESSVAKDYSDNGLNGTVTSATWNQTGGHDGFGAYTFDGTATSCVNLGAGNLQPTQEITLEAWGQYTSGSGYLISNPSDVAIYNYADYYLVLNNRAAVGIRTSDVTGAESIASVVLPNETYYHVAGTYDGTKLKLYVDGELVNSTTKTGTIQYDPFRVTSIGSFDCLQSPMVGNIDDVRVYDRALSAEQIKANYLGLTNVLVAEETSLGEVWRADITPNDGLPNTDGATVISNSITVSNVLPTIGQVTLSTSTGNNLSTENLVANVTNTSDADNDSIRIITNWLLNGSSITGLNMPFEGENGTQDYSGNALPATEQNVIYLPEGGYDGGGAYQFIGAGSSCIALGNPVAIQPSEQISLEARAIYNSGSGHLISNPSDEAPNNYRDYDLALTDRATFWLRTTDATGAEFIQSSTLATGVYHHVVGAYDGSNMYLYVNGQLVNSTAKTGSIQYDGYLETNIGSFECIFETMNGTVDDVRIYNRALSADQVQTLYENNTLTIASGQTRTDEVWAVDAIPHDGAQAGIAVRSNNLTISGVVSLDAVIINSSLNANTSSENLTATPINVSNPNNGTVVNVTTWYKNNESLVLLHYPFEGGSVTDSTDADFGSVTDYGPYSINGTLSNTTQGVFPLTYGNITYAAGSGRLGSGALNFTRLGNRVTIGSPSELDFEDRDFSISAWVDGSNYVVVRGDSTGPGFGTFVLASQPGNTECRFKNSTGAEINTPLLSTSSGWRHVGCTWDASEEVMTAYRDNESQSVSVPGGLLSSSQSWFLGCGNIRCDIGGRQFQGLMDEVMFWNTTLSEGQMIALANDRPDLIDKSMTTRGENWSVCVTPNDGIIDGEQICSSNMFILNSLPVLSDVVFNSSSGTNTTEENLSIFVTEFDEDNDSIKLIHNWYVDGQDYAVLNMPFEGSDGDESAVAKDYSSYSNNGTVVGATWNASGGYDGYGAYFFDTDGEYLNLSNPASLNISSSFTTSAWVKLDSFNSQNTIIAKLNNNAVDERSYMFYVSHLDNTSRIYVSEDGTGTNRAFRQSAVALELDTWYHLAGVYDSDLQTLNMYVNGQLSNGALTGTVPSSVYTSNEEVHIGQETDGSGLYRGYIDDLTVFNTSLSAQQILALYENRTDLIVSQETSVGEVWSVEITPNDGLPNTDGLTVSSANLTILNSLPVASNVVLNSTFGTNTTDENLTVYASTSDADSDSVKLIYNWYVDGQDYAVLNMPFEGSDANESAVAKDYSSNSNNGTVNGAVWNQTGGYDGFGAYEFDGADDYVQIGGANAPGSLQNTGELSVSVWVKFKNNGNNQRIIGRDDGTARNWFLIANSIGTSRFSVYNGTQNPVYGTSNITDGQWHHIVGTNDPNGSLSLYVDGILENSTSGSIIDNDVAPITLGLRGDLVGSTALNGTIDEVRVYDHALSAEQVYALFTNRTDTIVSQETSVGEVWSVEITPNDGLPNTDGLTVSSGNLTIQNASNNAPGVPTLLNPTNGLANSTDRLPTYNWTNAVDVDGDNLTYQIQVSTVSNFSSTVLDISGINETTSVTAYNSTVALDTDQTFFWRVRANDGQTFGNYSAVSNFTVVSFLSAGFSAFNVTFDSLLPYQNASTETGNSSPFILENTGNVVVNISIEGTPIFTSQSIIFPSNNYQYRVEENETGSFNIGASTQNYTNVTNSSSIVDIVDLEWFDQNDTATIHVRVTVPGDEPSGNKQSGWTISVT